jgi:hypothetical protein
MRPIVVAVVALFVGAVSLPISSAQAIDSHKTITLTLPPEWVPFSADVLHVSDRHITTGRFHRRRDGSTAHYLNTDGGAAITIHNLQTRRTYLKLGDRGWLERPVDEKELAGPLRELRLPQRQVQVLHDAVVGEIIEFTNAGSNTGVTRLMPRLNAFQASFHGPNGVSREYLNIRIGDQPDELFVPPPGIQLK